MPNLKTILATTTTTTALAATCFLVQVDAAKPKPSPCTLTTTLTHSACCPQIPAKTEYAFTHCGACVLATATVPLNCFAPCTAAPTVDRVLTTTVTECDQIMSILPVKTPKQRRPRPSPRRV